MVVTGGALEDVVDLRPSASTVSPGSGALSAIRAWTRRPAHAEPGITCHLEGHEVAVLAHRLRGRGPGGPAKLTGKGYTMTDLNIEAVAKAAGVHRSTVSRAFSR